MMMMMMMMMILPPLCLPLLRCGSAASPESMGTDRSPDWQTKTLQLVCGSAGQGY